MPPVHSIDQLALAFDDSSLFTLNVVLAFIMFGVALDLKVGDFVALARDPRAPLVGLFCQVVLLPAFALPLALLVAPTPSMALGMILVASCPGGNVSNALTQLANGRVSVSVGMTAVSTLVAVVTTPANFAFWGSLHPWTRALMTQVALDPLDLAGNVALILGAPCLLGMAVAHFAPGFAARMRRPMKALSILFFVGFVAAAFAANFDAFLVAIGSVALPVAVLDGFALALGWTAARLAGLGAADRRAVAIEVGIRNSGLGLLLVFNFFGGLGGMAVICAWWGIWHILAGLTLAGFWSWLDRREAISARR